MRRLIIGLCLVILSGFGLTVSAVAGQSIKLGETVSGVSLISQDRMGLTLEVEVGRLDFVPVATGEGSFILLTIDGFSRSYMVGEPNLPVVGKLLSIPFGCELKAEILNYDIEEISLADFGLTDPLLPVQPSISKSQDPRLVPFEYNRALYEKSGYYSLPITETETVGTMRALHLGKISIAPIEYDPVANRIRVYKRLVVKIDYLHPDWQLTDYMLKNYYSPFFEPVYLQVLNYEGLSSVVLDDLVTYPVKYVIISDRMFEAQLQPFIEWKTKKGFTVITAYTDVIGYNNTAIKSYIQNLYNEGTPEDPAPSFVLFVGDAQQIPPFTHSGHISDLDFCEFTGDDIPEIYYGRFSAENTSHLQPQIDKTLEYEQYLMPDPSYLGEVTLIAGVDSYYAPTHGNGQINYGVNLYFNPVHGITSNTWLYPQSDEPGAAAAIIQTVNNGIGFINYTAHGSHSSWSDPQFSSSNVNGLTNAHKYPLAIGNCCLTNTFGLDYSTPCLGEVWLRANNKGAIGYIGGSNSTYWDEDYWWGVGYGPVIGNGPTYEQTGLGTYDGVFHDHGEPVSQHYVVNDALIFCGNMAVEESGSNLSTYYWQIYHLMGDQSVATYMGMPSTNSVIHDGTVLMTATSFTVQADPGSYIGISVAGDLHGAAYVDSSGTVDVTLVPFAAPGEADIVITAQNRIPYISTIQIIAPTGPYVIYDSSVVNDIAGNNNGLLDCGESILLGVQLINVGPEDAHNVVATLSSDDSCVTITENFESYGTIPGSNGAVYVPDAFAFDVAGYAPDGHNISFELEVTGTALDTWSSSFVLAVHAPALRYVAVVIDDSAGNGNGILDPGEAAALVVTIENTGSGLAQSVSGTLSEDDIFVSIGDANGFFGDIEPEGGSGDNSIDVFVVSADRSCPMGHAMTFALELTAMSGYLADIEFSIIVGDREVIFFDDFSSNQGWMGIGGPSEWTIGPATGGYGSDSHGGPDPSEDHSPTDDNHVLGNDLLPGSGGDYNANINSTFWVTSPVIDCSDYTGVIMTYYRWLGVERNTYDHAYLQVFNGSSWVTLFENGSTTIDESAWSERSYDLSDIADENADFQIRYGLGSTDYSWQWCGWNIDDLEIKGYFTGMAGCDYLPGDINGDGQANGSDVTYGVRFFKGLGSQPPDSCWDDSLSSWLYVGGDVSGNCRFTGSDITFLVAYLKTYNPELLFCPRIPPSGPSIARPGIIRERTILK